MGKYRSFLFDGTRECICKLYSSWTNIRNIAKMLSIPRTIIPTTIQKFKNLEIHKESYSMVQKNAQINERSESKWG